MKQYCYDYPMPAVTTDCIIIRTAKENELLLIKRKHEPFMNKWAFPGGFVEIDEDLGAAAMRELKEETGIEYVTLTQFKTFGKPGRDPRGRTISVVYSGEIENEIRLRAGDDAAEANWFPIDKIPDLAFDHQTILDEYLSLQ